MVPSMEGTLSRVYERRCVERGAQWLRSGHNREYPGRLVEMASSRPRLPETWATRFDVLAEGLLSKNSRGDKTPLELFLGGVQGWDIGLRRQFDDGRSCGS